MPNTSPVLFDDRVNFRCESWVTAKLLEQKRDDESLSDLYRRIFLDAAVNGAP